MHDFSTTLVRTRRGTCRIGEEAHKSSRDHTLICLGLMLLRMEQSLMCCCLPARLGAFTIDALQHLHLLRSVPHILAHVHLR